MCSPTPPLSHSHTQSIETTGASSPADNVRVSSSSTRAVRRPPSPYSATEEFSQREAASDGMMTSLPSFPTDSKQPQSPGGSECQGERGCFVRPTPRRRVGRSPPPSVGRSTLSPPPPPPRPFARAGGTGRTSDAAHANDPDSVFEEINSGRSILDVPLGLAEHRALREELAARPLAGFFLEPPSSYPYFPPPQPSSGSDAELEEDMPAISQSIRLPMRISSQRRNRFRAAPPPMPLAGPSFQGFVPIRPSFENDDEEF